jgi:penicillin-binding protein 1C
MIVHIFKMIKRKVKKIALGLFALFCIYFIFCLPSQLFEQDYSKVLLDRNGHLLEARIAKDNQWRFPLIDSVPPKFEKCILRFEDQNFHQHIGVSLRGLSRAIYLNVKEQKVVSGASTITMQTIRLLRKNKSRTFSEKFIEMIWASRLEFKLEKEEILRYYSTHAPFGGNVVGLETASWRYLNRPPNQLSWAESAMLAVLPNAPGLIHLNKNRETLKTKRDKLLKDLLDNETLSAETYVMAISEPLPKPINSLPHHSYHYINRFTTNERIKSTIDLDLQQQFISTTDNYSRQMKRKNIHNLSAVLIDIKTGEIKAYIGNIHKNNDAHAGKVDIMTSVRSSGSILKPLLYNAAIDNGTISPKQLLPDYPISFSGYQPSNYNPEYDGMVPADEALYRSLNVPAAWLLKEYGNAKFKTELQTMGLSSINRSADDYGLSLILGGAEVNLLQLTGTYAALAHKLDSGKSNFKVYGDVNHNIVLSNHRINQDVGSIYTTLSTITNTYRPETEANWKNFASSTKIAWKTGTSFGNRDAWAVGTTPEYAIGVWIGNSDGQGVSGLTGLTNAAPLLFQLLDLLPSKNKWFHEPYSMTTLSLCTESGMQANDACPKTHKQTLNVSIDKTDRCYYHKNYLVKSDKSERVYKQCYSGSTVSESYFVLPPIAASYYQRRKPSYESLPPLSPDCKSSTAAVELLYPKHKSRISLPLGTAVKEVNAKAFYQNITGELHWELNGSYVGSTVSLHEKLLSPQKGKNKLTLIDENGNSKTTVFEVI